MTYVGDDMFIYIDVYGISVTIGLVLSVGMVCWCVLMYISCNGSTTAMIWTGHVFWVLRALCCVICEFYELWYYIYCSV